MDQIHAHQFDDGKLRIIWDKVLRGESILAYVDSEGVLALIVTIMCLILVIRCTSS